jgi:hypothetical protein
MNINEYVLRKVHYLCENWAHSLESLMEGHNWLYNHFVEIPLGSVIV